MKSSKTETLMYDDNEYCAVCEDPEFGEDGKETHADEDEYDHDFVYEKDEEEGDEGLTLDDVKNVADTIKSIAEAGEAVKKVTKTETPRPLHDEPPRWPGVNRVRPQRHLPPTTLRTKAVTGGPRGPGGQCKGDLRPVGEGRAYPEGPEGIAALSRTAGDIFFDNKEITLPSSPARYYTRRRCARCAPVR